jgi:hypothetical protein
LNTNNQKDGAWHQRGSALNTATAGSTDQVHLGKYLFLLFQLALLALILRQFQIESNALLRISLLAFIGFAIHYFLPTTLRQAFFGLLSIGGLALVMGIANAAWIIGFGALLIAICHLPLKYWYRAALLTAAGIGLAVLRVKSTGPWSNAVWPILGAMFMFRTVVYLYDKEHENVAPSWWRTIAYFFPLPNVCFPMFPVFDYKSFRRGYYDIERHRIYQIGVDWMARGALQLVLYRVVYYHVALPPAEVIDPDTLTRFIVANFMLYLKISGTFHLITGMMHLFGFNLIETHHRYCLASSFTDLWRRINIYWKDFMMKIFYYPIYFRLKRYGATTAVVTSTIAVFICTWLLHSYQWFWLRGDFPIAWQDGVFWMILAVFVVTGSLKELKHGRARSLSKPAILSVATAARGLSTVGIFFAVCVLWSLWGSESLASWLSLWDFFWRGIPPGGNAFPTLFLLVAATIFLCSVFFGQDLKGEGTAAGHAGRTLASSTYVTLTTLLIMAAISVPAVYTRLGTDAANGILSVRSGHLSRADAAMQEKGYYEDLTRVNRFNSQLWQLYMNKPVFNWLDVHEGAAGLIRYTGDFQGTSLTPNFKASSPYGSITINEWGMRDHGFTKNPADNEWRIAIIGPSIVMGWGVTEDKTFEAVLEQSLNSETTPQRRYEVMNFGVPGYQPPQNIKLAEQATMLGAKTLVYAASGREMNRAVTFIADSVRRGIKIPYPAIQAIVDELEINAKTDQTAAVKRLTLKNEAILSWVYAQIAAVARAHGATPVWVYIPPIIQGTGNPEAPIAERLARDEGFQIISLNEVFAGVPADELWVEEWDHHPNARGHRLIAEAILKHLEEEKILPAQ